MTTKTDDLRIREIKELLPPVALIDALPVSDRAAKTTADARQAIHNILAGNDDRLLAIVGPCSIHDVKAGIEYAAKLKAVKDRLAADVLVVMRVYFENPRTTVGWKGLINDPYLDDSFQINDGLRMARKLLLDVNDMGVPAGTEYLDMITPQYVADLISWGAIGARTTESQIHRELASGLSCPVGFKNGTDGNLRIAIDAIRAAAKPHHFLSVTKSGHSAIVHTAGNPDCHVILRGGKEPNYEHTHIEAAAHELKGVGLPQNIMIDFSHANSRKKYELQMEVAEDVSHQIAVGDRRIFGVMIESHLVGGRQDLVPGRELVYGQSITDACLAFAETEKALELLADAVRKRRNTKSVHV